MIEELLRYDPESGELRWLVKRNGGKGIQPGDVAGTLTWARVGEFYLTVKVLGKKYRAHRLCWFLYYGEWPTEQIDHKNGDGCDNRLCNLRLLTNVDNCHNKGLSCANTSGATGVTWFRNRWTAYIERRYLGAFDSFEEAVAARAAAEQELGYTALKEERGVLS